MDMAVANLLKHKIRLTPDCQGREQHKPESFIVIQRFKSPYIENVERMDASLFKPFIMYTFSNIIHEHRDIPIEWRVDRDISIEWGLDLNIPVNWQLDRVEIVIQACESEDRGFHNLTFYRFENPVDSPELFFTHSYVDSFSFPEHLLNEPFFVLVGVKCYYSSNDVREAIERRFLNNGNVLEPLPPPIETYRQDCCIICLELKPNILYFDCMHICICESCDRIKSKTSSQSTCDICRAEISERIKI